MTARLLRAALLLGLSCAALPLLADAPKTSTPAAGPDPELMEFLADWQGADGRWVDPMTFARIDPAKVAADEARRHGKTPVPAAGTGAPGSDSKRASR